MLVLPALPLARCASFRSWLGGGGRRAAAGGAGANGDAKLLNLGLESTIERRRVMAIVTGEEEAPSLMNWFEVRTVASTSMGLQIHRLALVFWAGDGE